MENEKRNLVLPNKNRKDMWLMLNNLLEPHYLSCKKLTVDFKNVKFLDPDNFVILACYLEKFYRNNCFIEFININENVEKHLEHINFKQYFDCNIPRPKFTDVKNKSTIPLWNIQKNEIVQYTLFAKN